MPASKAKSISSVFCSAGKIVSSTHADDVALKHYVSSLVTFSTSSFTLTDRSIKLPKQPSAHSSKPLRHLAAERFKLHDSAASDSGITWGADFDSLDSEVNDGEDAEICLDIPWFSTMLHSNISLRRKEISRERKQKWVFKGTQTNCFQRLVNMCAQKLGSDATIQVFGKLGRETGVKEYNALMGLCIDKARNTEDEEESLQQIYKAYKLFKSMGNRVFREKNSNSVSRLSYYEMLLWIGVNNEVKIKELCDNAVTSDDGDRSILQENYLLALSVSGRKKELLVLLNSIDITKVSSVDHIANIFKSLGRLLLESFAKKFLQALKIHDIGAENISNFIYNYAISMPNLAVGAVILNFNNLHAELEVAPSSVPYEKLIRHCCDSLKVHTALDIVDQILEAGLTLSVEIFHSILNACEESCEYNLVHRIYALMCRHNLKPNSETFRCMISLSVKMKDYDGAYGMISDLVKMNLMPTANMYNAIMAGYFREKNFYGGLNVLKEMEKAEVKPDSQTFSYLIGNCSCEKDITKYYEELKNSGVQVTKHIYMALINAYATCGQLEKAKQVVFDKGVPAKNLNEIKSVLVSALASHGEMPDALKIYEELRQTEHNLEPRAIISLIEHFPNEGELNRLLQLLEELNVPEYWVDGCFRVILYCVRHKQLSYAVDLLEQLKDKFYNDEVAREVIFDEVFCQIAETEPVDLQIGLDLLQAIKKELGLRPSRKSLDFLLAACAKAKDLRSSYLIWREYETAGLPYNVLSFLRMYQALLALGDGQSARKMLRQIPTDDPHVCYVIKASQAAYGTKECIIKASPADHKAREEEEEEEKRKKKKKNVLAKEENSEEEEEKKSNKKSKKKKKKKKKVLVKEENSDV